MKTLLLILLALSGTALAHPVVVESQTELPFESNSIAHSGDDLIAMQWEDLGLNAAGVPEYRLYASLYTRVNGLWQNTRELASEIRTEFVEIPVSMNMEYAAIAMPSGLLIFERTNAGWIRVPLDVPEPLEEVFSLDLSGQDILAAQAGNLRGALVISRRAGGDWETTAFLDVPDDALVWNHIDLDQDRAMLSYQRQGGTPINNVRIFERDLNGNWYIAADLGAHRPGTLEFGPYVAIYQSLALVSGENDGAHVLERGSNGSWSEVGHLRNAGAGRWDQARTIQINGSYVFMTSDHEARRIRTGYLYRRTGNSSFEHIATFAGDEDHTLHEAWLSGNRIIGLSAASRFTPLEFTVPADLSTPPLVLHDFETGAGPQWTPQAGGSWSTTPGGASTIYRQSSLAGDATSLHSDDDVDQSISAEVRINAFEGADRWVGLITRYVDAANYYYLTLRDSNRVEIRRMRNGVFDLLATAPLDVAVGQTFNLKLESSGSFHAGYVDGQLVLRGRDATHAHGRRGLRMYKASADYDNVVVSPGPTAEMVHAGIQTLDGNWVEPPDPNNRDFSQTRTTGEARRSSGNLRVDQSVQALVTIDAFSQSGTPWVGLMTRYIDAGNYYYVTVRKSNVLSLRKLTNGSITVLRDVPLTVTPGTPFVLRLDAIEGKLIAYVNGVQRAEAAAEEVAGKVGVMTYRTAASFSAYTANEL